MADWELFPEAKPKEGTVQTIMEERKSQPVQLGQNNLGDYKQLHSGPIVFRIENPAAFYNLNDAAVEVRFCLKQAGGNDGINLVDRCALISGGWHLFRRAELYIAGSECLEFVDYPGYSHSLYAAMNYSPSMLEQAADAEFIYPECIRENFDSAAQAVAGNTTYVGATRLLGAAAPIEWRNGTVAGANQVIAQAKFNKSFQRRQHRLRAIEDGVSSVVSLMLPLRTIFGVCNNIAKPIRGTPIELRLYKSLEYSTIIHGPSAPADDLETVLLTASLWVPQVMPPASVYNTIEQAIKERASAQYVFESRNVYLSNIFPVTGAGGSNVEFKITMTDKKPIALFLAFQNENQFGLQRDLEGIAAAITDVQGAFSVGAWSQHGIANGGIFSHLNDVYRIEARLNNKSYPLEGYSHTFANESTSRAYMDFLRVFYRDSPQDARLIDYKSWCASPMWGFKFDDDDLFAKVKSLDVTARAFVKSLGPAAATSPGQFRMVAILVTEDSFTRASDGQREIYYKN